MTKEKKKVLGILLLIFILIILIILIINREKEPEDSAVNPNTNIVEKRFEKVNDYEEFFSIQATINDVNNISMDTSYTVKEIYVNGDTNIYYYFIRAEKLEDMNYEKDVYLLLILNNKNKFYELNTINEKINNLEEYAKNYEIKDITVNGSNRLLSANSSIETILTIYLNYFKKLLVNDSYSAFNMLSEDTKAKYVNYEDFNNRILDIYNSISSKIFSYSLNTDSEEFAKVYYLEDDNRNKITIYEDSIMDFTISY